MKSVSQKPSQKLPVENKGGHLTVKGTGKDDKISVTEKNGKLYVKSSQQEVVLDPRQFKSLTIDGGNGNDRILVDPSVKRYGDYLLILKGGKGNDFLQGGNKGEKIYGGDGNDTIDGAHGADFIDGGKGNDTINGSFGDDKIYDREGKNTITANRGTDSVTIKNKQDNQIEKLHSTKVGDEGSIRQMRESIEREFGVSIRDGKERVWSLEELDILKTTLKGLPPPLQAASRELKFDREVMSQDKPTAIEGVFYHKKGRIHVYDLGTDGEDIPFGDRASDLKGVIVHEIAHAYDWKDGKYGPNDFWRLSGWEKVGKHYFYDSSKHNFARDYGRSNPHEDFATAVEFYLTDPQELLKNAPDKFNYLFRIFGPPKEMP